MSFNEVICRHILVRAMFRLLLMLLILIYCGMTDVSRFDASSRVRVCFRFSNATFCRRLSRSGNGDMNRRKSSRCNKQISQVSTAITVAILCSLSITRAISPKVVDCHGTGRNKVQSLATRASFNDFVAGHENLGTQCAGQLCHHRLR